MLALNTDIFILGVDEIFKLRTVYMHTLLHAVSQNKPTSPFVSRYSLLLGLSMVYNHVRSFDIQWNKVDAIQWREIAVSTWPL